MKARAIIATAAALCAIGAAPFYVLAHCQIPCGIYDDAARFAMMTEDVATIEKSMQEIATLSGEKTPNWNQLVRWIQNKDEHAEKLAEIVTAYFMTQRLKPLAPSDNGYAKYVEQLTLLHQMLFYAMKAKQTTDLAHCEKLRALIAQFQAAYPAQAAAPPPGAARK